MIQWYIVEAVIHCLIVNGNRRKSSVSECKGWTMKSQTMNSEAGMHLYK